MPAAAKVKSEAGAIAFVKYFIDRSSKAWESADPALIEPLVADSCKSCKFLVDKATELRSAGNHYGGLVVSVERASSLGAKGADGFVIDTTVRQHAVDVVDKSGRVVDSDEAKDLNRVFELRWSEGTWSVVGIG